MIGLQSIMALAQQFFPELAHILSNVGLFEHAHHHGHSHAETDLGPNINAAWLAGGSIIVKEWLYRATLKVAKQKRSSVLASNAYHHRVDSLTAFVALITICASKFLANAQWLDPVGGLVISGMIVQAGWTNTKTALFELADVSVDSEITGKVQKAAKDALQEQDLPDVEVRGVQGVKSGQNILVDVDVAVPSDWSVGRSQELEQVIREKVAAEVRGIRRVVVRFSSAENQDPVFAKDFVARRGSESEVEIELHADHGHGDHDHGNQNGEAIKANGSARKRN
jgi:cation diffusion facilitator family transporter